MRKSAGMNGVGQLDPAVSHGQVDAAVSGRTQLLSSKRLLGICDGHLEAENSVSKVLIQHICGGIFSRDTVLLITFWRLVQEQNTIGKKVVYAGNYRALAAEDCCTKTMTRGR